MPLDWKYDDLRGKDIQCREFLTLAVNYKGDDCIRWPFNTDILQRCYIRGHRSIEHPGANPGRILCEEAHGPEPAGKRWIMADCIEGQIGCINPQHVNWRSQEERLAILAKRRRQRKGLGYEEEGDSEHLGYGAY